MAKSRRSRGSSRRRRKEVRRREEAIENKTKPKKRRRFGCLGCFGTIIAVLLIGALAYGAYVFFSVRDTTQELVVDDSDIQTEVEPVRDQEVSLSDKEPFSVLLMGIDTGDMGRTDVGRSDVMIVATVNPNTNTSTLTSIPRDTLTPIVGYGTEDKINHAYAFGGAGMAANTVQNLLEIPIDETVSVDMAGFAEIVNAVGGIDIVPTETFTQEGYQFVEGQSIHLDGEMALAYSRNRYDSGGDYGRQERARQIIMGIIDSAAQLDILWNFGSILDSLEGNVQTSLSLSEMTTIARNYRSAADNIEEYQLMGTGENIDGIYYEILDPTSLANVQDALQTELEME